MQHGKKTSSYETLNLRSHAYMYIAPNKIHFDIIVKIFKTNLCLYYFDGSLCNKSNTQIVSGKQYFYYNKDKKTPTFNLFYNLNHYSKYYDENEYVKNRESLRVPLLELKENLAFEEKYSCSDCNDKDTYLIFFLDQNIKVCYKCLKKMLNNILFNRALNMDLESYISRECN